jgi:hypothetical protein
LQTNLYAKGPWKQWDIGPLYGYKGEKFSLGGTDLFFGYQHNVIVASPYFSTNSQPFVLDPYHGFLDRLRGTNRDVRVQTIEDFRNEYPHE